MDMNNLRLYLSVLSTTSALDTTCCEYVGGSGLDDVYIAIQQKLINVLSDKLRGDVTSYGDLAQQRGDSIFNSVKSPSRVVNGTGDFLMETSGLYTNAVSTLTKYFNESPYWDICHVHLELENSDFFDTDAFQDMDADLAVEMLLSNTYLFCETMFPDGFFEPELVKLIETGTVTDIKASFEYGSDQYEDGLSVFKSALYIYYERNKALFTAEEQADMKLAVNSICSLYGDGYSYVNECLNYGYFVSVDNGYYMMYGNLVESWLFSLSLSVMVAGQVIDELILLKDEQYHFLPDELRRKNVTVNVA